MLSKPENPISLQDKLLNLENVIKGITKLFKLVDRLQKKILKIYALMQYDVFIYY